MADQKKVELGREDAAELRCARLEVEARAAEYRESLRVLEGLRLQAEHRPCSRRAAPRTWPARARWPSSAPRRTR